MMGGTLTEEDVERYVAIRRAKESMPELQSDDPELELEENLEFKVETIEVRSHPAVHIEEMLNTGWNLYHEIVCPPYVILFFSREREKESGE